MDFIFHELRELTCALYYWSMKSITLRQGVTLSFRSKCHGTSAMTVLDTIPGESSGAHQWGYVFDIIKHISDT